MKKSEVQTKWILLKAKCNNEYTDCNSALVTLSEGILDIWKDRWNKLQDIVNNTEGFCGAEWLYSDVEYLKSGMESIEGIENSEEADDWYWVIPDGEEELEGLDEKVDGKSMHITGQGEIWFQGFGKFSGDEYNTESIDIDKLK